MQSVQITIRDIPYSDAIENHIQAKSEKLSRYFHRINSCRVIVDLPQKHKHQGKLYNVRIDVTVPGKELAVTRKKNQDVYIAIRDAFHAVTRQLETYFSKIKGYVKHHKIGSKGVVERLFIDDGYGFIHGVDGIEYYFSPVHVTYPDFARLQVGDSVEFLADYADEGLQAHHIKKLNHNNLVVQSL